MALGTFSGRDVGVVALGVLSGPDVVTVALGTYTGQGIVTVALGTYTGQGVVVALGPYAGPDVGARPVRVRLVRDCVAGRRVLRGVPVG
ncbi:hypothetical protein SNL152K_5206 [Streptomyces sp. NL15-2K]|nr:hypothetical protein SNL152K_5206 [Streptomyces sp. NL15-2K]